MRYFTFLLMQLVGLAVFIIAAGIGVGCLVSLVMNAKADLPVLIELGLMSAAGLAAAYKLRGVLK